MGTKERTAKVKIQSGDYSDIDIKGRTIERFEEPEEIKDTNIFKEKNGQVIIEVDKVPMFASPDSSHAETKLTVETSDESMNLRKRLRRMFGLRAEPNDADIAEMLLPSPHTLRGKLRWLLKNDKITGHQSYRKRVFEAMNGFIGNDECVTISHGDVKYLRKVIDHLKGVDGLESLEFNDDTIRGFERESTYDFMEKDWAIDQEAIYFQVRGEKKQYALAAETTLIIAIKLPKDKKVQEKLVDEIREFGTKKGDVKKEGDPWDADSWYVPDIRLYNVKKWDKEGMQPINLVDMIYGDQAASSMTVNNVGILQKLENVDVKHPKTIYCVDEMYDFIKDMEEGKAKEST